MVHRGRVCSTVVGGGSLDNSWLEAESVGGNVGQMSVGGVEGEAAGSNSNRGGDQSRQ